MNRKRQATAETNRQHPMEMEIKKIVTKVSKKVIIKKNSFLKVLLPSISLVDVGSFK